MGLTGFEGLTRGAQFAISSERRACSFERRACSSLSLASSCWRLCTSSSSSRTCARCANSSAVTVRSLKAYRTLIAHWMKQSPALSRISAVHQFAHRRWCQRYSHLLHSRDDQKGSKLARATHPVVQFLIYGFPCFATSAREMSWSVLP